MNLLARILLSIIIGAAIGGAILPVSTLVDSDSGAWIIYLAKKVSLPTPDSFVEFAMAGACIGAVIGCVFSLLPKAGRELVAEIFLRR